MKKTDRMTRLIQWMIQANWNALLTVDTIQRDSALHITIQDKIQYIELITLETTLKKKYAIIQMFGVSMIAKDMLFF